MSKNNKLLDKIPANFFENMKPRHVVFVKEYIANGSNQTQAALKAGYSQKGAVVAGQKILKRPEVVRAIDHLRKWALESSKRTIEDSIKDTIELREEARRLEQYTAAVNAQKHLDALTGLYDPRKLDLDVNLKPNFSLTIVGINQPNQIAPKDVTPKEAIEESIKEAVINGSTDPEDDADSL